MEEFDLNQQLVRHLKSHAVWLGRIARRDDQLAGPCMVLWEELKTGLLFWELLFNRTNNTAQIKA